MRDATERANLRALVRRGYDQISRTYRPDPGEAGSASAETTASYAGWIADLAALLPAKARVLDLGCGCGVPAARDLARRDFEVLGVDISSVQIARARRLVTGASFVQADITEWDSADASFDAVVSLYALIHVPLEDQRELFPRVRRWLVDGGYLLAIVGAQRWTGVEDYLGAEMFWDDAELATYLDWLREAGLEPQWHRYIPEGDSGHTLVLARAAGFVKT